MTTSAKSTKQMLLLEYLISSPDTYALCRTIVKPAYFNPELRSVVEFVHEYYDKYNATPSVEQVYAETDVQVTQRKITRDEISYCADEVEAFCRRRAVESAIVAAPQQINKGNYTAVEQAMRDALLISLNRDLGIDYFADPHKRISEQNSTAARTPTKWADVDANLNGGLARTEIILFSANSGGGKSITLANLAVNMLEQNLNVLYITLELAESLVAQRFDTMFTGVQTAALRTQGEAVAEQLVTMSGKMGKLFIKHMPSGTTANAIRAYLKEFQLTHNINIDLLVIDYLDIMGANENVSADNVWEKDKRATEQLRDIGFDYNMFIATASQQNRAAIDAQQLNQGHIAGGISKVNTVDVYISVILTPTMKAAGEIGFVFLKTRNSDGAGKTVYLKWINNSLRIVNPDVSEDNDTEVFKKIQGTTAASKQSYSLEDLLNSN